MAILLGGGWAALDEFHQEFVPSRTASPRDVAVDTSGVCAGVALALARRRHAARAVRFGGDRKLTLRAALGYASGPMRTRHVVATCCAVLLAAGCQQAKEQAGTSTATPQAATGQAAAPTEESTEIIATYAGKKLTGAEVLSEIDRLPGPSRAYLSAPDRKRQFVENLILNDLLFAEAQKAGYDKDPGHPEAGRRHAQAARRPAPDAGVPEAARRSPTRRRRSTTTTIPASIRPPRSTPATSW